MKLLVEVEAPIIVANGGVHSSAGAAALAALRDAVSLPVGTTTMDKGVVAACVSR